MAVVEFNLVLSRVKVSSKIIVACHKRVIQILNFSYSGGAGSSLVSVLGLYRFEQGSGRSCDAPFCCRGKEILKPSTP